MATGAAGPVLELTHVVKTFGPVVALADGVLAVHAGSIHALIGENGAGKSTLVKIVAGVHQRDSGAMRLGGEDVDFRSTAESKAAGVAVIYQEPTLFPDLSVAENIFMGRQPRTRTGAVDRRAMRAESVRLFERLGVRIDPDRPALGLSIADQQLIEIAKAISLDARLLVMDEPTAALSGVEVERLFAVARSLRDEGRALVFISHRFDEIFALCDAITVMRDGAWVSTDAIGDVSPGEVVQRMVGREVETLFPKTDGAIGDVLLAVDALTSRGVFEDVSFTVRAGEIVGFAGLVGAGRTEVLRAVFGVDSYDSGSVRFLGRTLPKGDPRAAIRAGIGLVPEDRRKQGLILDMSIARNLTLVIRRRLARAGLLARGPEYRSAHDWARRLQVKAGSLDSEGGTLSGGNQQKVVLAKWLATGPKLLVVDEPTRGIDVGTKAEVLGMSDRVYVMREGRITAELSRAEATSESVMTAATRSDVRAAA